METLNKHH
jgi:serine/threonine protein phosphatase PrpC